MDAMTTATQNLVVAFNNNTKATTTINGQTTTLTQIGPAQVVVNAGPCRLVNLCVVASGAQQVEFYNSQSLTALPPNSLLYVLDVNAPLGITQIGLNFSNGLCMIVGAGVSVNCTYSVVI
jgi:hypothetical protein